MKIDLDHIEKTARLAQKRNPGPWRRVRMIGGKDGFHDLAPGDHENDVDYIMDSAPMPDGYAEYCGGDWFGERVVETDGGYYDPKEATAEHIANMSPDVVLAMVERIRELEAQIEESLSCALDRDTLE
jgi:hypothetical protein